MKFNKRFYLFFWFVLPLLSFSKADERAKLLFEKGNACYAKAQYQAALNTYRKILNEGYQSAIIYYNLGNASYKMGDIPHALLYFEKGHKLAPGDEDINFNIRLIDTKITDKIDQVPEFFVTKWYKELLLGISINTLSIFIVVIVLLASVMLIIYLFTISLFIKKASFYASFILFILGVTLIFVANRQVSYFHNHHQAIIFGSSVTIKSSPDAKSKTLFLIHEGTKVNVLESSNGWNKIGINNGNEGWMKGSDLREI